MQPNNVKNTLEVFDYSGNKQCFLRTNGSILGEACNITITEELSGAKYLNLFLPLYISIQDDTQENHRWQFIKNEALIKHSYDNNKFDWYIVKGVEEIHNGKIFSNIQCEHISFLLNKKGLDKQISITGRADQILTEILKDTGWSMGTVDIFYEDDTFIEKIRIFKTDTKSNSMTHLQDVAKLFEGYLRFNPNKTVDLKVEIGEYRGVQFRYKKNLKSISRRVESNIITRLYVEGGSTDNGNVTIESVNPTSQIHIDNYDYYINSGMMPESHQNIITQYNSDILSASEAVQTTQLSIDSQQDILSNKTALLDSKKVSKMNIEQKVIEIDDKLLTATSEESIALNAEKSTYQALLNTINSEISTLQAEINSCNSNIDSLEVTLTNQIDTKNNIDSDFKADLYDFIHEGYYQFNQIDPQALYNDAVSFLKQISMPRVAYELSILDLSTLTGYELEKFYLGDLIDIVDEPLKLNTLARITKITTSIDKPWDVDIEISNFDTSYNELLKRIAKTTDYIQQKKDYWSRAEKALNPDGSIGQLMLQKTFDENLFQIVSGTNNSVTYDSNGITVKDLQDANKMVRINAGIISITEDGGNTWNVAMTSKGINFKYAIGGKLDINEIALYGSNHFYWNHRGLYAINPNNSNHWIRFNNDGIAGTMDNGASYNFNLSWNGLTITRSDGKVKTTMNSTDGFKIESSVDGINWVNKFWADTNGKLNVEELITNKIKINNGADVLIDADAKKIDFSKFTTIVGKLSASNIKTEELIVGSNIAMGSNATISWSQVTGSKSYNDLTDKPSIPYVPSYIQSTKITGTSVESCTLTGNTINGGTINVTTDINVGNKVNVGSPNSLTSKYVEFFNNGSNIVSVGMGASGLLDITGYNGIQIYDFSNSEAKLYTNGSLWLHGNKSFKLEATIAAGNSEESIIKHNGSGNLSISHNGTGEIVFNKTPYVNGSKVLTEASTIVAKFA